MPTPITSGDRRAALSSLAWLFLRLGCTAFGGPAAHVAMMEDEVVRRRQWLTREEFLDLVGATNLIPGPNSTELAIHIGHRRAGWPGLLVAGCCFILPASIIVLVLAWAYVRFGQRPQAEALLYGVKPVIIAIVAQALIRLGRTALKSRLLLVLGLSAACLAAIGINELAVLFGAGALMMLIRWGARPGPKLACIHPLLAASILGPGAAASIAPVAFGYWGLFLFFLKTGSVLFGSGYVLLVFLRADLVERWGWLSEAQLLDAIAIGQITPGPLFTTATFIGYLLGGGWGALLATVGIFLPAFFFVAISGPFIPRLRRSPVAGAFLDGVNVASLALMAVVCWHLATGAVIDWYTSAIGLLAGAILFRYKLNSAWLVLGGALAGLLASAVALR